MRPPSKEHPDDPQPWTTLASTYLHRKEPWLVMRQDRVRLPGGGVIEEYFVWEFPPWVNVLPVTKSGDLVLIRQYRYALGQTHYELPAGTLDPGETDPLGAARRELLEETGYGGGDWQLFMTLSANPALQNNLTFTYLAEGVEPLQRQELEHTEEIAVRVVSHAEARRLALGDGFMQALHVAPLLRYLLLRETGERGA
jgi:8-oxo-dGTP pyrophosphatase MutT (NUDIX family)